MRAKRFEMEKKDEVRNFNRNVGSRKKYSDKNDGRYYRAQNCRKLQSASISEADSHLMSCMVY